MKSIHQEISKEIPYGLAPRVVVSIIVFFGLLIFGIIYAAFYASSFSTFQKIAVIAVAILAAIAILGATWASWGIKYGRGWEEKGWRKQEPVEVKKVLKSDEEWKELLTPEQYHILREAGTETAGSCAFSTRQEGVFHCIACDNPLFISKTIIEAETKWPSFFEPYPQESIILKEDNSHGMKRTEVICAGCGGHLGHVFDDGPPPTYKRYCINGTVLKFVAGEKRK